MRPLADLAPSAQLGLILSGLAILLAVYLAVSPRPVQLPLSRRRPGGAAAPGLLERMAAAATRLIDRLLRKRGTSATAAATLELAGVKLRPQDFVLLLVASLLVAAAIGVVLAGTWLAILLALAVPVIVKLVLSLKTSRRQRAFADQLDDSLQMMASSLRAGHSLLQALNTVAQEAPQPASEEFSRVVNENRVGRDIGQALGETAARMDSRDMLWVAQAIAINRKAGGNLAEVLDRVGHTVRERGQIRRQVKSLSAEGRLSAIVLMVLPFAVTGFLLLTNPAYLVGFTESLFGYGLLAIAGVLLIIGGLWLRKVTTLKF